MGDDRVLDAAALEKSSPDEWAIIVHERSSGDVSDLDPEFRARVEETPCRLAAERGLIDLEHR